MAWLPVRPGSDVLALERERESNPHAERGGPPEPEHPDVDVLDVARRGRAEALAAAAAGYTQAYGHPLGHRRDRPAEPPPDHPHPGADGEAPPGGRRWWLSTRHAVVAGIAVAILTTGVVIRAATGLPGAPVDLPAPQAQVQAADRGEVPGEPLTAPGDSSVPPGPSVPPGSSGPPGSPPQNPVPGAPSPGVAQGGGGGPVPSAPVVVHVVGQVLAPGVLSLPSGSRVGDAVAAAGGAGPAADLSVVNLARVVVDGEQVRVPAHGEDVPPTGPGAGPTPVTDDPRAAGAPVPLNSADAADLDALPGIGPVLAQRILDWRTANGPFRSIDELGEVSGIGEALLTRLRPLVQV